MDYNIKLLYVLLLSEKINIPLDMDYPIGTMAMLYGNVEMCALNRTNLTQAVYQRIFDNTHQDIFYVIRKESNGS